MAKFVYYRSAVRHAVVDRRRFICRRQTTVYPEQGRRVSAAASFFSYLDFAVTPSCWAELPCPAVSVVALASIPPVLSEIEGKLVEGSPAVSVVAPASRRH